ncbi:MAG: thermosome subunit alpha [Candidatus Hydrothermarchaeaceae archaeon]
MAMQAGGQQTGQPIYVLKEGAQRYLGKDARMMNIMAGRVISEAVKSTMGPKGMDKMLVDATGDAVITNDGATILKEVDVKHPAAKMMVDIAKTVEKEVGDGTTAAVVIAGELLKRAEELLDQNIHATVVVKGYRMAADEATKILEKLSKKVAAADKNTIKKVAITALNSKAPGITAKEHLADLATGAAYVVAEKIGKDVVVDKNNIKIQKRVGASTGESELVKGIVIDKERAQESMPTSIKNAKIALLNVEMKIKKTETDAKVNITSPDQLQAFLDEEEGAIREMIKDIKKTGANCLFCQKSIDDLAEYLLAKEGILAVTSVSSDDMELLSKASGANIVTSIKDISKKDLGKASKVEEKKVAGGDLIFVEGCPNPKAVTLFVRGSTEHVVNEVERSLDDVISVVKDTLEDNRVVPGGGATMMEVAKELNKFANKVGGREQLAVREFATAMEVIPKTLAENAGLDPIDSLIALRAAHEKGNKAAGINLSTGKPTDMYEMGIIEPFNMRAHTVNSATEVTTMILRIDDVIAAKGALGGEEE